MNKDNFKYGKVLTCYYCGNKTYMDRVAHYTLRDKEPKNKTSKRAVAILPEVVKVLKKHKAEQNKEKLSIGNKYQTNNLVCCMSTGEMINPSTFSKRFQEVVSSAGLKVRFHDLRHAHASYLLKQGIHPKVVSERLGHSNISMTMDLYSHIAPTLQQDAADGLDKVLFSK